MAISLVLDAPYTGRFTKGLAATANVEALLTPGGSTSPSFAYLPGVRSGSRYVRNPANPRRLQETSNQIATGLKRFVSSGDEVRRYQRVRSQGNARSLVSWMLVRSSRLGAADAIVPKVKGAPKPLTFSRVAVTAPVPRGAPTADASTLTVDEDDSAAVTFSGSDPEEKPLTFEVVDAPANGDLVAVEGGVRYTPVANYHGADSFTYRAIAEDGVTSAPATVSITVTPVNDGPTGGDFDTSVDEDSASTTVAAPGLLASASDVDGDQPPRPPPRARGRRAASSTSARTAASTTTPTVPSTTWLLVRTASTAST
ncbi:Ig-like domain-containing protein [Aeromicrobium sp. UC242_57]|uniref:Ig-like domain-containing protein n=1 Tax=Aeromicrobium sp. UC242_57 TaxID=3374624 RepID=UPI0037B8B42F